MTRRVPISPGKAGATRATRAALATFAICTLADLTTATTTAIAFPVPHLAAAPTKNPTAITLPPAVGKLFDYGGPRDCGVVYIHSDDTYYTGIGWSGEGAQLPYYGAFAECFSVDGPICGIVLDLTQTGGQADHTVDLYVWADDNGAPGEILSVRNFVDPGPVAPWPEVIRHILPIPEIDPEGPYWVGFWGNWEGATPGYYIGVDGQSFENGCPYTNIAPSLDFPDGWNHVNVAFGPADALGIGVQISINEGIGACCLGQNCFVITFDDCFQHDGVYTPGADCTPNPCVTSGIEEEFPANQQVEMTWGRIRTMYR